MWKNGAPPIAAVPVTSPLTAGGAPAPKTTSCPMMSAVDAALLMFVYLFVAGCTCTQAPFHGFTLPRIWRKKL